MKIHEYQAKELFSAVGIPVPPGVVCSTPAEAGAAYDKLAPKDGLVVIKSQVHAGGRGKGEIEGRKTPEGKPFRGVSLCKSRDEVVMKATGLLGGKLVTYQNTAGSIVNKVLIAEGRDIAKRKGPDGKVLLDKDGKEVGEEYYLAVTLDRAKQVPVMIASAEGGVEIEEVAKNHPEKILKEAFHPTLGLLPYQALRLADGLGFTGKTASAAAKIFTGLAQVFLKNDCSIAEINPLILTPTGELWALDGKVNIDDNALFRHPKIEEMRDLAEEDAGEMAAKKFGMSYISLDGTIGCLVNGAGLAMATLDVITLHGGRPANFLDVGGGANQEAVTNGFKIILSDPKVKAVLVNIFGGIMNCATIAGAIIAAFKEVGFKVPLIVRLEGNNVEAARKMIAEANLPIQTAADLDEAAAKAVAGAKAGK
jgi:succinyl-CoA synthetase beta subunit